MLRQGLRDGPRLLLRWFLAPQEATSTSNACGAAQCWWGAGWARSTTVLCVRKGDQVVMMADGQVTAGAQVVKPNVKKLRELSKGKVIGGFAGSTTDAFTLFEQLEGKVDEFPGQLARAAVELARSWRSDKFLRRLDAMMVVADAKQSLTISGNGDVLDHPDGINSVGSGAPYALAAARALIDTDSTAEEIAKKAMSIAADFCVYTNHNVTSLKLASEAPSPPAPDDAPKGDSKT